MRHVKQVRNSATKMVNRQRLAGELVALYEGGMRAKSIFWSDETWVDENKCARRNPKNDRKYNRKSTQNDSVSGELKKPIKLRTPKEMAHITVCCANGGGVVETELPPTETNVGGRVLL